MSKIGRNKKACERYRTSGKKTINKLSRQERHRKRMEYFAKRRAEGNNYVYKPITFAKGTEDYYEELHKRSRKNVSNKTPLQKITSIMRKLDNELEREKQKKALAKRTGSKNDRRTEKAA